MDIKKKNKFILKNLMDVYNIVNDFQEKTKEYIGTNCNLHF